MKAEIVPIDSGYKIIVKNYERAAEDVLFEKITEMLKNDHRVKVLADAHGPSEDIIKIECGGERINIVYDVDYGIDDIVCSAASVHIIKDIVENAMIMLRNDKYKLNNFDEFKFSIDVRMDIEFYLRGVRYNISWRDYKPFICVCPDGDAVFFENADELLSNYKVDGIPLRELWHEMDIISM